MNYTEYLNKVGLVVNTLLTPFTTSSYGAYGSRVFEGTNGVKSVVLHTTGNPSATAKNEATNIHNNKPNSTGQSFHAVADEHGVYECVKFSHSAYHSGDKGTNLTSLGFELSDNKPEKGYANFIKYVAWAMYQEGIVPSESTVKFHNEIVSTSCGSFLRNKGKKAILEDLHIYIAIAKGDGASKPVEPSKPVEKPNNSRVGKILVVRKKDYHKPTFVAYEDKECKKPLSPWTMANYAFDLTFYITEDRDPVFKCIQWSKTPIGGVDHVYIKWESGVDFVEKGNEGSSTPQPAPKPPVDTSFKESDMVTCNADKDIYHTQLDKSMFNGKNKFKVMQIGRMGNQNHVLLAGVMTWVEKSTCKKG